MRPFAQAIAKWLWTCLLVLSIPWAGPVINPHILEHEAQHNRARAALSQHLHEGVHFEAVWAAHESLCLACMRTHSQRMAATLRTGEAPPEERHSIDRAGREHIPSFRLTGRVAARAPPLSVPRSI